MSSGDKINLIEEISDFPDKEITYNGKVTDIKSLINTIYELFYENKGYPIPTVEIVKRLFGYSNAGRFFEKVVIRHLCPHEKPSESTKLKKIISPKLISTLETDGGRYYIYPLALVLKTAKGEIYDFTSPPNLSETFDDNFKEISETVMLNICRPPIALKEFLDAYNEGDSKIILRILIDIAKNLDITKTELLYDTPAKLKEDVSRQLEGYREKHFVNPSLLPYYPKELKQLVTENRAEELRDALKYLEKHRILLISGVGGVGKSTFARALIDLRPVYVPDPFWFDFNQNQDAKLGDILEKLASYMNAPEIVSFKDEKREPGKNDVDKFINELQKRSEIWLVFDNLETVLEAQQFADRGIELLFSSLRYNTHNAKVVITSRILPVLENGESLLDIVEGEEKQYLTGLKTNFAIDYLTKNGLNDIEQKKLEKLTTDVDGHPLSLKLLVELVKEFGVDDILEDSSIYMEQNEDIIKKARKLFDKLAGEEKELLERISVYRRPVDLRGLKEMFTETTPKNAVKKLMDKSLLETGNGNYWLHPLVKEFSYEDLDNKKEAHKLATDYYLSLPLPENSTKREDLQPVIEAFYHAWKAEDYDLAWSLKEKYNLPISSEDFQPVIEAFYQDCKEENYDLAWSLMQKYNFLSLLRGNPKELIEMCTKLLPKDHFTDEQILKDKKDHGKVLEYVGEGYYCLSEFYKAIKYHEQALKIARDIGDRRGELRLVGNLKKEYKYLGEPTTASKYEQALPETSLLGKTREIYNRGDQSEEIKYYESALKNASETGNKEKEGIYYALLGTVYSNLRKHKEAIEYCEKALDIVRKLNVREFKTRLEEEEFLGYLGFAHRCSGDLDKASDNYKQALKIAEEIGDRIGKGRRIGSIGIVCSIQGKKREAIDNYYKEALKIAKDTGDRGGEGKWLGCLGLAYSDLGEDEEAIKHYKGALQVCRKTGYRRGECEEVGFIGNALSDQGKYEEAIECYEQARKIAIEIEDKGKEETWIGAMGLTYSDMGKYEKAIEHYEEALEIANEIEDKGGKETWLRYIQASSALGRQEEAIEYKQRRVNQLRNLDVYGYPRGARERIEFFE